MNSIISKIKSRLSYQYRIYQQNSLAKKFHSAFATENHCYISQNCLGGRFYKLAGRAYTSPTVGLWFEPSDFLSFCEGLESHIAAPLVPDEGETQKFGYPVGRVNGIKILFQHYSTFEEAKAAWEKRLARISIPDVFYLMTDRDGFSDGDFQRFNQLPTKRKILFSHKPVAGNDNVVYVPGFEDHGLIGDLYVNYHLFHQAVSRNKLIRLLKQN